MTPTLVRLASFANSIEAQLVAGRLEEEGIQVFLSGDLTVGMFSGMPGLGDHIILRVRPNDLARAQTILAEPVEIGEPDPNWGPEEEEEEEEHWICSICGDAVPMDLAVCPCCDSPWTPQHPQPNDGELQGTAPNRLTPGPAPEPTEDQNDLPAEEAIPGDIQMRRAWHAALFGCITQMPPFFLYSMWIIFLHALTPIALSSSGRWQLRAALLIDGTIGLLNCAIWCRVGWEAVETFWR